MKSSSKHARRSLGMVCVLTMLGLSNTAVASRPTGDPCPQAEALAARSAKLLQSKLGAKVAEAAGALEDCRCRLGPMCRNVHLSFANPVELAARKHKLAFLSYPHVHYGGILREKRAVKDIPIALLPFSDRAQIEQDAAQIKAQAVSLGHDKDSKLHCLSLLMADYRREYCAESPWPEDKREALLARKLLPHHVQHQGRGLYLTRLRGAASASEDWLVSGYRLPLSKAAEQESKYPRLQALMRRYAKRWGDQGWAQRFGSSYVLRKGEERSLTLAVYREDGGGEEKLRVKGYRLSVEEIPQEDDLFKLLPGSAVYAPWSELAAGEVIVERGKGALVLRHDSRPELRLPLFPGKLNGGAPTIPKKLLAPRARDKSADADKEAKTASPTTKEPASKGCAQGGQGGGPGAGVLWLLLGLWWRSRRGRRG